MKRRLVAPLVIGLLCATVFSASAQPMSPSLVERIPVSCNLVYWCAFAPDSTRVVMNGCVNGWLFTWRIGEGYEDSIYSQGVAVGQNIEDNLSFNHDSTIMVSHGRSVKAWSVDPLGVSPIQSTYGQGMASGTAFTPDGTKIVVLDVGVAEYDATTGEELRVIVPRATRLTDIKRPLALRDDGGRIAFGTDSGTVQVHDYETGERIWKILLDAGSITRRIRRLQFSPDGRRLLVGSLVPVTGGNNIETAEYDAETGERVKAYNDGSRTSATCARYDRSGRMIVMGMRDSTVRIINVSDGTILGSFRCEGVPLWAEFSAGGTRVVVGGYGCLSIWDLNPVSAVSDPASEAGREIGVAVRPNPARDEIDIVVTPTTPSMISVELYDALGRLVGPISEERLVAASHRVKYDVSTLPSGVYSIAVRYGENVCYERVKVVR